MSNLLWRVWVYPGQCSTPDCFLPLLLVVTCPKYFASSRGGAVTRLAYRSSVSVARGALPFRRHVDNIPEPLTPRLKLSATIRGTICHNLSEARLATYRQSLTTIHSIIVCTGSGMFPKSSSLSINRGAMLELLPAKSFRTQLSSVIDCSISLPSK